MLRIKINAISQIKISRSKSHFLDKLTSCHKFTQGVVGVLSCCSYRRYKPACDRNLISLPEQELVDCDTSEDQGCKGGLRDDAFEFIIGNNGLTTESNYPYEGVDGTCSSKRESSHVATIMGYEDVPTNNESALLNAVANQPIFVAIDVGGSDFQFYSTGVFTGKCGTELNHAVTAVGYEETTDGTKYYWLIKNSWGTSWGENEYIRMQRNIDVAEGLCGIAMQASYPTA